MDDQKKDIGVNELYEELFREKYPDEALKAPEAPAASKAVPKSSLEFFFEQHYLDEELFRPPHIPGISKD